LVRELVGGSLEGVGREKGRGHIEEIR